MPTNDTIVSIPFVAGLNQQLDPDQLQPPELITAENVVARRGGRLEKRSGFHLVESVAGTGTPATAFGGSSSAVSGSIEAIAPYYGKDGVRPIMAAGNSLYEYVGSDAAHGWRTVNKLPACIGTLHPVDSTGGSITEVESMMNADGTLRCTAWIIGTRNGQDLTNDSAINNQALATPGVFVAVQKVSDGSFVTSPTRISLAGGGTLEQCCDLRMGLVTIKGGARKDWVIAYRRQYSAIEALSVQSTTGTLNAPQLLLAFASRPYHRAFDFTGLAEQERALFAFCDAQSTSANEDIQLRTCGVTSSGVFTLGTAYPLISSVGATAFIGGAYVWSAYKARGVVLETSPASAGAVSVGARLVYQSTSVPSRLDGKMIVASAAITVAGSPAADTISVGANKYGVLHRIGFKTDESLTGSFVGAGARFYSSSVSMLNDIRNPSSGAVAPYGYVYITGQFSDGTVEVYQASAAQAFGRAYTGLTPYKAAELQRITQAGYVKTPHIYDGVTRSAEIQPPVSVGSTVPTGTIKINKQQITNIQIDVAHGIPAAEGWVITGNVKRAGVTWCVAQIYCAAGTGHFSEVAIVNGNPGNPLAVLNTGVGYQADQFQVTSAVNINSSSPDPTGLTFAINTAGAIHLMFDMLNSPAAYGPSPVGTDVSDQTTPVAQTWFDSTIAPEPCVHRWDVATSGSAVILAMSSTSAGVMSNPNGDVPLGYVSPFAESNYFEVYEYPGTGAYSLNEYAGGAKASLWAALGGPWRMISSLAKSPDGRLCCIASPSGDDFQKSSFLLSFARPASLASVSTPKPLSGGATIPASAQGYLYANNQGVFVESLNMARVAAVPLNCPRLTYVGGAVNTSTAGAIRQGQTVDGSDVFALDYDYNATSWRIMRPWNDYTMVNGGLLTAFDGGGANEAVMLLWPQRDLTSVAYERNPTKLYAITPNTTQAYSGVNGGPNAFYAQSTATSYLTNITRPWFAYEAGFNNAYGTSASLNVDMAWAYMSTFWGGKATDDYQAVYADPRMLQVSAVSRPSFAAGLNEASTQHYYGRYQSGYSTEELATIYNEKMVIWAPRANSGVAALTDSNYTPTVANGDFLARWCYEAVDATGRIIRSAPSQASTFSICTRARYAADQYGGVIDEYRYGFFVPRLELTNRLKTATSDSKRVVLQPYFTAEPFATVFYKVPFSSFLSEYSEAFTVPRNATRGIVPYSSTPVVAGTQYGLATNNLSCFDGPQASYYGLLSQPYLYTTGGVLDNVPPPSARVMCVHQNRLVIGGADDPTVVWFSKELTPTDAPAFNDALTLNLQDGGAVTGLASLNGNLVVFKRSSIFVVPGVMPDSTGVSQSLGEPIKLPAGVGCVEPRSVVETPVGVFFVSERGLEILYPTLQVEQIGQKVREVLTTYPDVVSAIHNPGDQEARFLAETNDKSSRIVICYSYQFNVWSTHKVGYIGSYPMQMATVDGVPWIAARTPWSPTGDGVAYVESSTSALDILPETAGSGPNVNYVKMTVSTAPIDVHQVQGFQRVKRARLLLTNKVHPEQTADLLPGVGMVALTDYNESFTSGGAQSSTWTSAEVQSVLTTQGRVQVEVHLREQKGQALQIGYVEQDPASPPAYTDHGWGLALSNIGLVVGLKKGLDKRILPTAKH